jgi:UDP-2-acetamido-3-amino-2,3-dideoxy-glucuronate N-acetyltransferase
LTTLSPSDKLIFYPHQVVWKDGLPVPDKKDAVKMDWERTEPLRNQCRHFLDCIANGGHPLTDGEEGLRVLKVLDACQKSMKQAGQTVELPSEKDWPAGYQAHPSAVIDQGAKIGPGSKIWHFSHILGGARIGPDCNIGQNVVISPQVSLGRGCKIQNNVSLYQGVRLEDYVFCGPSMVFTNVKNPRSEIGRMDQVKTTLVKNRRQHRGQRDYCLRKHPGALLFHRRGRGGHQGRARFRHGDGQSRQAQGLDLPLRGTAARL